VVLRGKPSEQSAGRTTITIRVDQTGDTHVIKPGRFGRTVVPVKLDRGLNHIYISAAGPERASSDIAGITLAPLLR